MQGQLLWRLAKRSFMSHRLVYGPFILANILLFAANYILISLNNNDYIQTRHINLPYIMMIGIVLGTLVIMIISYYTSRFVQESLTKEYGLYSILGLEKKHIQRVSLYQNLMAYIPVVILSSVLGYFAGNFFFVILNRVMQDTGATFMDYPMDWMSVKIVIGLVTILFIVIQITNTFKIHRLNPLELFKDDRKGQGDPKSRWVFLIIGLVTLGLGYYFALTITDVMSAFQWVLVIALLVLIGTYALTASFITIFLKFIRSRRSVYYKPQNFLTISGMLHRLSRNAVSIASIAILVTGVIMMTGLSLTTYRGLEHQVENVMRRDHFTFLYSRYDQPVRENVENLEELMLDLEEEFDVSNGVVVEELSMMTYLHDNEFYLVEPGDDTSAFPSGGQNVFLMLGLKEDLEPEANIDVSGQEWIISSNSLDITSLETVVIGGAEYPVKETNATLISSNEGTETVYLALNSLEEMETISQYPQVAPTYQISETLYFDSEGGIEEELNDYAAQHVDMHIQHASDLRQFVYELNGGLIFIGILMSILLTIGTVLVLYYKQIGQGVSDRHNYQIMKQVGLPNSLIRKTIRQQVLWLFFLPLIIGIIHNAVASHILFKMMGILGLREWSIYFTSFALMVLLFAALYFIFFLLTSRSYYQIVNFVED